MGDRSDPRRQASRATCSTARSPNSACVRSSRFGIEATAARRRCWRASSFAASTNISARSSRIACWRRATRRPPMRASIAAFYRRIAFVHVEAGLRTPSLRAVSRGIPPPLDRGIDLPALRADLGRGAEPGAGEHCAGQDPGVRQHGDRRVAGVAASGRRRPPTFRGVADHPPHRAPARKLRRAAARGVRPRSAPSSI